VKNDRRGSKSPAAARILKIQQIVPMRQAGIIDSRQDAERFVNYLIAQGISSKLEAAAGRWAIWIHDENLVPRSKEELERFQLAPQDERYRAAEEEANTVRREMAQKRRQAQRNYHDMRNEWASPWRRRPVTLGMIAVCVALAFNVLDFSGNELLFSLPRIEEGEVWRLITPIFLHADLQSNPLHLIFNMLWLYDLGTLIERRLGSWRYAVLVVLTALVSNLGQFLVAGPNFVGMSGVVYGLLGYAWIRGRMDPTSGFYLHGQIVAFMLGWLVVCIVIPQLHVANGAHVAGLAAGAALGYLPHLLGRLRGR
jgi:GlpG protein